jgi:outer membrane receptor protein involved in Fe transport
LNGYADNQANTHNRFDKCGRLGFNLDGTYYGSFAGQHTLKAGVQFERISNEVDTGQQNANIAFNWNASRQTLDNPPRLVRGTYGYYTVSRIYTTGDIHSNNVGIFLQDAWTVNSRLTLNLGVRVDSEDIPSYLPENPGISFGFMDKLAPRVGFAYDITGDGTWKGYGSFGMFYDIQKLEMPRGLWGGDKWVNYYFTLDTFDWPSISCSYPPVVGAANCPGRSSNK